MRTTVSYLLLAVVVTCMGCTDSADESAAAPAATSTSTSPATSTTTKATTPRPTTSLPTTSEPSEPSEAPGFDVEALQWTTCGAVECATLTVPLDHGDPTGPTIDIAVARAPAARPDERIGALIFNPGGPGASGVDFVRDGFRFTPSIHDRFDIVSFDPRGVGASTEVDCEGPAAQSWLLTDQSPDDQAETELLHHQAEEIASTCTKSSADLLGQVSTADVVEDLELLRRALGDEPINFIGLSYGTFIGQYYAEAYPDKIRTLILDGVVDTSHDMAGIARGQAAGFEASLQRLFDECDAGCPLDDAAATFDRLALQVETDPIPASGGDIGPGEFQLAATYVSYDPTAWNLYYEALAAAEAGDGSALQQLSEAYLGFGPFTPYLAINCIDYPRPDPEGFDALAAELDALYPRVGAALGYEYLGCGYWPVEATRVPGPVHASGAPPILVIGNTGDAATPYENSVTAAENLESGVLLTLEGEGHLSFGDTCIDDWYERYLVYLEVPPDGTRC